MKLLNEDNDLNISTLYNKIMLRIKICITNIPNIIQQFTRIPMEFHYFFKQI